MALPKRVSAPPPQVIVSPPMSMLAVQINFGHTYWNSAETAEILETTHCSLYLANSRYRRAMDRGDHIEKGSESTHVALAKHELVDEFDLHSSGALATLLGWGYSESHR